MQQKHPRTQDASLGVFCGSPEIAEPYRDSSSGISLRQNDIGVSIALSSSVSF